MNDEYLIYGETLTNIANSIRSVSSVSTTWTPDEMAAYILANLVKPTTRQAAKTYTPSTSNQTIPAGTFLTGAATIQGDADWVPGNIKKGVNMWGKTGTLSGIWGDASAFGNITAVRSGSFTLSSAVFNNAYTITHSLGVVPKLVAFVLSSAATNTGGGTTSDNNIFGFFGFQTSAATQIAANQVLSDGEVFMARLSSRGVSSIEASVNGYGATKGTSYNSTVSTMLQSNSLRAYVTNTSLIIGGSNTKIFAGTYKWLVMG